MVPDLSIVIPVYNEEKCSEEAIRRVKAFMSLKPWTWELIQAPTVREGVLKAKGRRILVTDAKLRVPIKEVDKLVEALECGYDIAIGSRDVREEGCDVQESFLNRLARRARRRLIEIFVMKGFLDTECAFKCYKKEAAAALFQDKTAGLFGADVAILRLAKKKGFRIKEVSVMYRGR